ncbi:MAG TPA: ADP-ribosylglycohydrolase family protein [Clostridiaceae bacterium]|nr:ADP-ribosylglycohydrolase family protein [Clostridiaceae bacterium]
MEKEKIMGALIGVVVGDAVGMPVQFEPRENRKRRPVTDMEGWGCFHMAPGSWSDDSSLTLCLTESLLEAGVDPEDAARRFVSWYDHGYWTPGGFSFDIGGGTADAMENLKRGASALESGPSHRRANGNGSLMRIMPAALYLAEKPEKEMFKGIWDLSGITHGHALSRTACFLYALMTRELLEGSDAMTAYRALCTKKDELVGKGLHTEAFERILGGGLHLIPEEGIRSSGYVIDSLEAALWCLLTGRTYKETILHAVNLGEDTDTIAAIAGGLAGILYGREGIPEEWVQTLVRREDILELFERFTDSLADENKVADKNAEDAVNRVR